MTKSPFNTPIMKMFGLQVPVMAGGLQWLADADYVAAAVNAGAMGFITAASLPDDAALIAQIRRCRELTEGKPFGVNISMLPKLASHERVEDIIKVIIAEGVPYVETSGRSPAHYLPQLHGAGIKVLHKVPALRYALSAQAAGVDAVALVGYECGGHPGMELMGTFVQTAMAAQALQIPYVVGGGVGTGAQIVAALAMGADGVLMGTRLLVAQELNAHPDFKQAVIDARESDTMLVLHSIRNTVRILANDTAKEVAAIEALGQGSLETLLPLVSGKIGKQAYQTGDTTRGALSMGHALAFTHEVKPFAGIIAQLMAEAKVALERLDTLTHA